MRFKAKVEVKYPMTDKDNDDSKSLLNEIGVDDEDDDADDGAVHDDEELLEVEEQYRGY